MNIGVESIFIFLPIILCLSAIFSASETVFLGLTADDRWRLNRESPKSAPVIERLLLHPRRLLLTIVLGNMTVNTLYFAIATVALASTELSLLERIAVGLGEVICLIVFGDVLPKMVSNSMRLQIAPFLARPVLVVYYAVTPVRALIEQVVFVPLHRLTAAALPASGPTSKELREFVAAARVQGDISTEEESLLGRLLILRRARVRDVMTHRTEMVSISRRSQRSDVVRIAMGSRLKRLPVVDGNNDRILGILDVRKYLLDPRGVETTFEAHTQTPVFVPEIAMLEQLFELFRSQKTSLAIVVDEFGGTAGVVALEDAIEEIIGDIVAQDEVTPMAPQMIDDQTSRVDGKMSARAFCAHFGLPIQLTRASTVGGIALEVLGNLPRVGQEFQLSSLDIQVEELERGRARTMIVRRTRRPIDDQDEEQSQ